MNARGRVKPDLSELELGVGLLFIRNKLMPVEDHLVNFFDDAYFVRFSLFLSGNFREIQVIF